MNAWKLVVSLELNCIFPEMWQKQSIRAFKNGMISKKRYFYSFNFKCILFLK